MDRLIEIKVAGSHLLKDSVVAGVQGEGNITQLRITFADGWAGFAKSITFFDARGKNPVKINLTVDRLENIENSTLVYLCAIPPEPLAHAGWCSFVIEGYIDDVRQRAVETKMEVLPAKDTTGANDPAAPTPTQAEQLQGEIDKIMQDIQKAAEAAGLAEEAKESAAEAKAAADQVAANVSAAETAKQGAEAAKAAAEKARDEAKAISGGDFLDRPTYDPTGRKTDIFSYVDNAIASMEPPDTGTLPITKGGTGATTASEARYNLGVYSKAEVTVKLTELSEDMEGLGGSAFYEATIGTDWTEDETTGVKSQTVAIADVTAADNAHVEPRYTGDGTSEGYAAFVEQKQQFLDCITNGYAQTVDGGVTLYIFGAANTVTIPVLVEVK